MLPPDKHLPNVTIVDAKNLGSAKVIVATADKWAFSAAHIPDGRFDAGVVDEGYQMQSAKLLRIADLFPALDFLGDPGQLDPFSTVDDARWRGLAVNPVLNAVDALLAYRGDDVPVRALPVTRRLPVSAAGVIREVFYPDLDFGPGSEDGDRELALRVRSLRGGPAAEVWRAAAADGWAYLELPHRLVIQPDREIVVALGDLVQGLFDSKPTVRDEKNAGKTVAPSSTLASPSASAIATSARPFRSSCSAVTWARSSSTPRTACRVASSTSFSSGIRSPVVVTRRPSTSTPVAPPCSPRDTVTRASSSAAPAPGSCSRITRRPPTTNWA